MPDTATHAVRRYLRALAPPDPETSDGQLLGRFLADRDDAAFAALVRRHGPLVLAVCRRMIGDHHLAEDACQAVFLVLARKAGSVSPRDAVGGWLYGVAHRTAQDARAMNARRRARECPVPAVPDRESPPAAAPHPAVEALDAEIACLPEKLRAAVVLCELEGRTRREAAGLLGVAEGTLSSRLAAARKLLTERLRGRGVVAAIPALFAAARAEADSLALAVGLLESGRAAAGAVPAVVAALAQRTICAMYLAKLRHGLLALPALAALAVVAAGRVEPVPAAAAAVPLPRTVAAGSAPVPKQAPREPRLFVWVGDQPQFMKPDGTGVEKLKPIAGTNLAHAAISRDGTRLAWLTQGAWDDDVGLSRSTLNVRTLDGSLPDAALKGLVVYRYCWGGDGRTVLVYGSEEDEKGEAKGTASHWSVDVVTGKRTALPLPPKHVLVTAAPDGKTLLTRVHEEGDGKIQHRVYLTPLGGGKPAPLLAEGEYEAMSQFSPDGRQLLCLAFEFERLEVLANGRLNLTGEKSKQHAVIDLETGKRTPVGGLPEGAVVSRWAWSPDGKQIAYAWFKLPPAPPPGVAKTGGAGPTPFEFHVVVADADGTSPREVYKVVAAEFPGFDWR